MSNLSTFPFKVVPVVLSLQTLCLALHLEDFLIFFQFFGFCFLSLSLEPRHFFTGSQSLCVFLLPFLVHEPWCRTDICTKRWQPAQQSGCSESKDVGDSGCALWFKAVDFLVQCGGLSVACRFFAGSVTHSQFCRTLLYNPMHECTFHFTVGLEKIILNKHIPKCIV